MMSSNNDYISLSDLNKLVKFALNVNLEPTYWVVAEISEMHSNYSGHCYLELIEKDQKKDTIVAKSRATIWANTFRMIKPYFETSTNQTLQAGLTVLIKVSVDFHVLYGLSINVKDIDPIYTLGEQQRRRMAIIRQLEDEGIMGMNQELPLSEVLQKIAVISSKTAAGYGDFMNQISSNSFGFSFSIDLYNATMQGDTATDSIISQLDHIYTSGIEYDAVVIIRGGGATSDLMCFDTYALASNIAQFPIPILTGIGHDRDETIADLVAHTSLKTPTAVAEFIIDRSVQFDQLLNSMKTQLEKTIRRRLDAERSQLSLFSSHLPHKLSVAIDNQKHQLSNRLADLNFAVKSRLHLEKSDHKQLLSQMGFTLSRTISSESHNLQSADSQLANVISRLFQFSASTLVRQNDVFTSQLQSVLLKQKHKLAIFEQQIQSHDPAELLKRGYSLTSVNGKRLRSIHNVVSGDRLMTMLLDGSLISEVISNSESN